MSSKYFGIYLTEKMMKTQMVVLTFAKHCFRREKIRKHDDLGPTCNNFCYPSQWKILNVVSIYISGPCYFSKHVNFLEHLLLYSQNSICISPCYWLVSIVWSVSYIQVSRRDGFPLKRQVNYRSILCQEKEKQKGTRHVLLVHIYLNMTK